MEVGLGGNMSGGEKRKSSHSGESLVGTLGDLSVVFLRFSF